MFALDSFDAKTLRSVSFGLSGSRAYKYPQQSVARTCDWDFVGVLDRRSDIMDIVRHKRKELCGLLRIDQLENVPWEVRSHIRFLCSLEANQNN